MSDKEELVTEEGIPYEPSATVFRDAIHEGLSVEEAEARAKLVGEARAETLDGVIRYRFHQGWRKFLVWVSTVIAAGTSAVLLYGTAKVTAFLSVLGA
jgi:hypothetical protein